MRHVAGCLSMLLVLVLSAEAETGDALYQKLSSDSSKAKALKDGMKHLHEYFKAEADLRKPRAKMGPLQSKRARAQRNYMAWLAGTKQTLGVDLRKESQTVIAMMDRARLKVLAKTPKGKLTYINIPDPKGLQRFAYSILVPKVYDPKRGTSVPAIVSMHGRVINSKHPAFRGDQKKFQERSRQVVFNNWLKTPAADEALIIAPTGSPDGFKFDRTHLDDLITMYRAMGEALTNYWVDWDRIFLEVHGQAMRVVCEQTFMYAGFIVRDRIDDRRRPVIRPQQQFMFENLNGTPLCYIADDQHWEKVGKPTAEALTAAYAKIGKEKNLVIVRAKRDVNQALQVDPKILRDFVTTHRRVRLRKDGYHWRFFRSTMVDPLPLGLGPVTLTYDTTEGSKRAPLEKKAGRLRFKHSKTTFKDDKGKDQPLNLIEIDVTEAEGCRIDLFEGLIDFDHAVTVKVNGKVMTNVVVNGRALEDKERFKVDRKWDLFWAIAVPRRFFMVPYLGQIECTFENKPEFQEPKPAGAKEENKKADGPAGSKAVTKDDKDKGK